MTRYNVYVIELDKKVLQKSAFCEANPDYDTEKPCVYVGQTAKSPQERFEQHKSGVRSNRYVKAFGVRLRPRLYEKHNPLPTREAAEKEEKQLAKRLKKRGYGVWWN